MIGQTISNFKILAKIAENATGTLYRAIDTASDQLVTIKVLSPGAAANPEIRTLLERARGLQHPNIARIDEVVRWKDIDFAVMEAPEGESVYDFLERERPKRLHLLRFAQQIASALEAANGAGIVHGPLDPAAIFITAPGQIKIYDFGFGILEPPPESEQERLISFGKSAPYVSPEQLQGGRPDVRSDIFSFGALLYHMTTGLRPFRERQYPRYGMQSGNVSRNLSRRSPPEFLRAWTSCSNDVCARSRSRVSSSSERSSLRLRRW